MASTAVWAIFVGLSIAGIVAYDVAVKIGTERSNVFVFMGVLMLMTFVIHLFAFGAYKQFQPEATLYLSRNILLLLLCGAIGLAAVNFGFFYAVKYGGLVRTNAVWLIGSLILTTLVGFGVFRESLDLYKIIGIMLGIASVGFLTK